MFVLRCIAVVFFLLVAQTAWLPQLAIHGITPDLILGMVFVLALRRGANWGIWSGFLLGLLVAVAEPASLGVESLAFGLTGWVVGRAARSVDKQNPVVLVVLLTLAALISNTVRVLWSSGANPGDALLLWFRWALPSSLYTAAFVPILAWVSARLLGLRSWVSGAA
jgi:rod shape-determining protein MreD